MSQPSFIRTQEMYIQNCYFISINFLIFNRFVLLVIYFNLFFIIVIIFELTKYY